MEISEIVLCQVEKIAGTTVFVNIEGTTKKGTIILPEISAGRIRNLRDYVVPKKTICCKILRIMNDHIELSLRRVTKKEQKEIFAKHKLEKSYIAIFKSVLKERSKEIISKIKDKEKISEFIQKIKENPKELEKLVSKEEAKNILEILNLQKKKIVSLKKEIKLTTSAPNGITKIKEILQKIKTAKVKYIAGGKYSIEKEAETLKKADQEIKQIILQIEADSKDKEIEFYYKE